MARPGARVERGDETRTLAIDQQLADSLARRLGSAASRSTSSTITSKVSARGWR
jgi:hypothetical protein